MTTETIETLTPLRDRALDFIVKNHGVVLSEWQKDPKGAKLCRVVFKATTTKPRASQGTSPFIKEAINYFYPNIDRKHMHQYSMASPMENDQLLVVIESDLEKRMGVSEWPPSYSHLGYTALLKKAQPWIFLDHEKVLLYKGD